MKWARGLNELKKREVPLACELKEFLNSKPKLKSTPSLQAWALVAALAKRCRTH